MIYKKLNIYLPYTVIKELQSATEAEDEAQAIVDFKLFNILHAYKLHGKALWKPTFYFQVLAQVGVW